MAEKLARLHKSTIAVSPVATHDICGGSPDPLPSSERLASETTCIYVHVHLALFVLQQTRADPLPSSEGLASETTQDMSPL